MDKRDLTIAEQMAEELLDAEASAPQGGVLDSLSEHFHPIYVPVLGFRTDSWQVADFFAQGPDELWTMGGGRSGNVILHARRDDSMVRIHVPRFVAELVESSSYGSSWIA